MLACLHRDRKRQKTAGLEQQVKQLQDRVTSLQRTQTDRQAAQHQNAVLQQELQGKLAELRGARATSSSDSMDSSRHQTGKAAEPTMQQLAKRWLDTVRWLKLPLGLATCMHGAHLSLEGPDFCRPLQ